jgi:hypothetical protein
MTGIPDAEQNILAVMPLHAITAVYGEQGLRARLAIETAQLDDTASQQKISGALELVADGLDRVHGRVAGQFARAEPIIRLRLARKVLSALPLVPP